VNRVRSNKAYILAELLCTILLIAIATAAIAPGVFNRSESAVMNDICAQIADLDRRARIASIADGPVVIRLGTDANVLRLISQGEQISSSPIVRSIYMLDQEGRPIQRVEFDRLGRSQNYTIHISADHKRALLLYFDGFSGRMRLVEHLDA
tara:strand:- start:6545 stop:6997 length:453 start_codon:yes stop_codon:yes gene_type:complete